MPAQDSRKTSFHGKKVSALLHRFAWVHVHFLRRVCMHLHGCLEHHACASVYHKQVLCASAYTCVYTLHGVVYEATCCWRGGLFLTRGEIGVLFASFREIGVLFASFLINAGGSVRKCMCVYTHTHTHTAHMGYSNASPGVWIIHLEGPKNLDGLNLGICVFVHVYKVHMCMHIYVFVQVYKVHICIYQKKRALRNFQWFLRHLSSVVKSAGLKF